MATILFAAGGFLNFSQRQHQKFPPTDGVQWIKTERGITAESIVPDSAAAHARIREGDRLIAVSLDDKTFEEIEQPSDVPIFLEIAGLGGRLTYRIEKNSFTSLDKTYDFDLYDLQGQPRWTARIVALYLVGLIYLLVGLFVLFKQGGQSPFVLHFATLCLAAFIFHCYRPIGTGEDFDLAVFVINDLAFISFAAIFLHFCLLYPLRRALPPVEKWKFYAVYLPAAALGAVSIFLNLYNFLPVSAETVKNIAQTLDAADAFGTFYSALIIYFAVYLTFGAVVLLRRFMQQKETLVRQRLKWVIAGAVAAVIPLIVFSVLKNLFQLPSDDWTTMAAILPLAFIPLSFGHSVVRYRLMDVDIVVRRAVVYALTTIAIAGMIGLVSLGVMFFAVGNAPSQSEVVTRVIIAAIAMAAIVLVSEPLKNFLQERADRFFYGERYDLRRSLLDFGRTLSATTALDPLLNALTSRLKQVLDVEKVTVLIENPQIDGEYYIARQSGLTGNFVVPSDFRHMLRQKSGSDGIVRTDDLDWQAEDSGQSIRREIHYFVPCFVRGRIIAVIGLGRANNGALLSSEDLEILRTVSGYVGVAIENSLLYQEQQHRAEELALLKDFNESIVESVNVGLLAVNVKGIVTRCNSCLENIFGFTREDIIGKRVEEIFDGEFADEINRLLGKTRWNLTEIRHAYKLSAENAGGHRLTLNVAIAPLQTQTGEKNGATILVEDVSERLKLETQLQQREKLSSIGLLAAGVAHEVNTPLTGVSSYTQMLLGMISEDDPKHALLQKVHRQTERATGIVGNLLNFSRAGSSDDFYEISVSRVLEDTIQLLDVQMRHSRIVLNKNLAEDVPPILGNAGKLQQVFTNLILNARDAITTAEGVIKITSYADKDGVHVEIADNGSGISPEHIAKIYDPFFTTKEVGKGTGLGLAVTYGIVQEHSGTIDVASNLNEGTTFHLSFPLMYPQQAKAAVV